MIAYRLPAAAPLSPAFIVAAFIPTKLSHQ
jgi:hypothetical protein